MTHLIEMSEDEFDDQYLLLPNHLNPKASWASGDGPGCLFETCGEELAFVRRQRPSTVWTLVDGDDVDQYLVSGYHLVNRVGYLVSTVAVPEGVDIQVRIPMQTQAGDKPEGRRASPGHADQPLAETARDPAASTPDLKTRREEALPASLRTRLLVPKGTPLVPGKMYLRLYHGRTDPDQQMDDWGFVGPCFGPLACYVHTYCCTFRIHGEGQADEIWLEKRDDMVQWDGCFYGDMEVFIAGANDRG